MAQQISERSVVRSHTFDEYGKGADKCQITRISRVKISSMRFITHT